MSDDEFEDDFEGEFIWYDEVEPDLADDLAIGAIQSPVLLDHPALETFEYPSDWEYYSDDYFDDDPSIVRQNKERDDRKRSISGKPKKKRKLTPTDEIPDMELGEPVENKSVSSDNFKGVIWRTASHVAKKGELYEPGQGEVVALLKNWREVFKTSQPRSDRRTQRGSQGVDSTKRGRKPTKGRISTKRENIYDVAGDEALEDGVSRTFTPPPYSLSSLGEPAVSLKPARSKPGSKLNNVMSHGDESSEAKLKTTTLPTRGSQPIPSPSDSPVHKGQFFSHVEISSRTDESAASETPQEPVTRKKRKASISVDDEEEEAASAGSTNASANSTTRGRSKRPVTRRKIDVEEKPVPRVTRATSTTSSSSRGRGTRGRPRGRGRGQRS